MEELSNTIGIPCVVYFRGISLQCGRARIFWVKCVFLWRSGWLSSSIEELRVILILLRVHFVFLD